MNSSPETTDGLEKILIHLVGGQVIETYIDIDLLEEDDVIRWLEEKVSEPPRPHWCPIGSALVFTQAIAGLELG